MSDWIYSPVVVAGFLGLIVSPFISPIGGAIVFFGVLYLLK